MTHQHSPKPSNYFRKHILFLLDFWRLQKLYENRVWSCTASGSSEDCMGMKRFHLAFRGCRRTFSEAASRMKDLCEPEQPRVGTGVSTEKEHCLKVSNVMKHPARQEKVSSKELALNQCADTKDPELIPPRSIEPFLSDPKRRQAV